MMSKHKQIFGCCRRSLGCVQGFFPAVTESRIGLSFGLGCQLGEVVALALRYVILALLKGLLCLVPSLLCDLLGCFLSMSWIGSDGGVSFLVKVLDLRRKS